MEYFVAPTYQNWKIEEINENTRKALVSTKCWKCNGSGQYAWFGVCFACEGTGHQSKWVKVYTEEEYNKYIANQEKVKERKAAKALERQQELINNSEENKRAALEKFGFSPDDPKIYLVVGENTYNIKDELKERGGRFCPEFNWYFTKETEIPEGYSLAPIDFEEVYNWNPLRKRIELKENASEVAAAVRMQYASNSNSDFVGEVKERLRDLKVTLSGARAVSSNWGTSIMFTFDYEGNTLVWFTSSPPDEDKAVVGNKYLLTGTVKQHKLYDGVKQTYLNRCILKEFAF